jgi:adenylate cyclase
MANIVELGSRRRKLAAILHADVVGFSRLMGADEDGTHQALGALRRAVDPLIAARGGRIVGTAGDSLLADFSSVVDALACAMEMREAVHELNEPVPPARRLELRLGVNLGDVIVDGDDIFGDGVNIAARLQQLAQPGTVCISHTVYEQVRNKLDLDYRPLGSHRVKNIAQPVRVYAVGTPVHIARPRRLGRAHAAAAAAVLVAAGVLAGAFQTWIGFGSLGLAPTGKPVEVASLAAPANLAGRPSIAVLPFKNQSADTGQDYFSDGITEDVITALGRFSNLLVVAKSASFAVKGQSLSPAEIGRRLDARYLLGGSVRRAGDRVRVNVELTEAATGRHVWSEVNDSEVKDIFAVQDKIAKRVVGAAAVKLTRFERERALANPTTSLEAYDYVLRGREFFSHATRRENSEARALFQHAIDLDPNYAPAYAGLGGAHYEAVVSGWAEFRHQEAERAERLARKALSLDPATISAYRLLALVNMGRGQFDLALDQIDRALEINPSDAESYDARGTILVFAGRPAEALPWIEAALRFDRDNGHATWVLGVANYFLAHYMAAITAGERALARNPGRLTQTTIHPFLAAAYAQLGRDPEAARERAIVKGLAPFFDAERFAGQFGTEQARNQIREGLKKAGFE